MDENNAKVPVNNELKVDIIQYLQQKYGLIINLRYGMLNFSKMELIKHDLSILERTEVGQALFKQISDLMKLHPKCVLELTSEFAPESGILNPKKKKEQIIIKININYSVVDTYQVIYLCKTESDDFFFVMTHHPSAVVLGHELGHLLQTLVKFDDIFIGTDENEWESNWLKMSQEEYQNKFININTQITDEIKKKFPEFKPVASSNLKCVIQNYLDYLIVSISNRFPKIRLLKSILTQLVSNLNFNEYIKAIKEFKEEYQFLFKQGENILFLAEVYYSFVFVSEVWNENNYEDLMNILPHEIQKGIFLSDGELFKQVLNATKEKAEFFFLIEMTT